jgi:hypothetical protein
MRKLGGWQWYHSIGLALSYSRCDFQTNRCKPHPVRGIKQRALFLLFANNNCFPTSEEKLLALFEFRRFFGSWGGGTLACGVLYRKLFFQSLADFLKLPSPVIAMTLK